MSVERGRREAALLVAFLAATGLAFTYLLAVRTPAGQQLDTRVMLDVSAALTGQTWTGTLLSLVSPMTVLAASAALTLAAGAWGGTRTAFTVLSVSAGTIGGAALLKAVLIRPEFLDASTNSLPSGHVAAIAGIGTGAIFAASPRYRPAVAILSAVVVGLTGLATLALQWHRPSDVLAATLVAVIVGALAMVAPGGRGRGHAARPTHAAQGARVMAPRLHG